MSCVVCWSDDVAPIQLPCGHFMCAICMTHWVRQTCPMCRRKYTACHLIPHDAIERAILASGRTRSQTHTNRRDIVVPYVARCIEMANQSSSVSERMCCITNAFEALCCNRQWLLQSHTALQRAAARKLGELERRMPREVSSWRRRLRDVT